LTGISMCLMISRDASHVKQSMNTNRKKALTELKKTNKRSETSEKLQLGVFRLYEAKTR